MKHEYKIDDNFLVALLKVDARIHEFYHKSLVKAMNEPIYTVDTPNLFDMVLDVLGVPKDNTMETDACEYANATGKWPDWGYSRDGWLSVWLDVVLEGPTETTIDGFPEWVRKQLVYHALLDSAQ